jgi:hypothetical protein
MLECPGVTTIATQMRMVLPGKQVASSMLRYAPSICLSQPSGR